MKIIIRSVDQFCGYSGKPQKIGEVAFRPYRSEWLILKGKRGFIISDNEFIHFVLPFPAADIRMPLYKEERIEAGLRVSMIHEKDCPISPIEFEKAPGREVDLEDWAHYWGIKARIQANYSLFRKSCREMGIDLNWPEWGGRPERT